MDKEDVVYIYIYTQTMEYYSAMKKNKILPFATTWIDLEGIVLSEVSQTEKDKYHTMWSLLYVECKGKKQAHRHKEQIGDCQKWEMGDGRNE